MDQCRGFEQSGEEERRGGWEERDKRTGEEVMEAVVLSLRETEEGKTERDYRQFKLGFSHTPSNWEMDFPQNRNDQMRQNSSFCVHVNCRVAPCRDWSFLSEIRPRQIGLSPSYTGGNTSPARTCGRDRRRTDSQLEKPFLINHGKKPESESASRSRARTKNKTTKTGKAFKRLVINCPEL